MPFAFSLPTTSSLNLAGYFSSLSHPSLPQAASAARSILRNALKKYKRMNAQSRIENLSSIRTLLDEYLAYLLAIDSGLSGRPVQGEEVHITLVNEIEVEWRASLAASLPGREPPRIKGRGLDYELCFVLSTYAYITSLSARAQVHASFFASSSPSSGSDTRANAINAATKFYLQANSIHLYIIQRISEFHVPPGAVDISLLTQSALASLALAEATLLAVLKDDPYPIVVAQQRNRDDREWMIKAPEIPKVRAHLFARLCLAAAGHAGKAHALLSASSSAAGTGVEDALLKYTRDLQNTSKAKACRFFGIDAELGGKTGEGIAWLIGAKKELGLNIKEEDGSRLKSFSKLKRNWSEKREDKKVDKGGEWGSDAGRFEETRILEMLETKWNKMNDTV